MNANITNAELAAVLAGLRLLQQAMINETLPDDIDSILCDGGEIWPVDADGIEALCARLSA